MSACDEIDSVVITEGVKIITYKDGSQHFEIVEDPQPKQQPKPAVEEDNRSWWQKLKDWWDDVPVKPYVAVRDLSDPFNDRDDPDKGSDGKSAVEIGIQIRF